MKLPLDCALRLLCGEPRCFNIVSPTPLLPGAAVRWRLPGGRVQGPGFVQLIDGVHPDRQISVLLRDDLRWIHERDILEIDPWPAIDTKLDEFVPYILADGGESAKAQELNEWLATHFGEEEFGG